VGRIPSTSRWPRRVPGTQQSSYFVDNRNPATDNIDRVGPYIGNVIPSSGDLQVPSTDKSGNPIMVNIDARLWLPIECGAAARSIVTNVLTNASFAVIYVQPWDDQLECFVVRRVAR
jgi:hypothetical protein